MGTLRVQRLTTGTLFRLIVLGALVGMVPISLVFGALGVAGYDTVTVNNQPVHGWNALWIAPLVGSFVAVLFGVLGAGICSFGLWVISMFRTTDIHYHDVGDEHR